MSEFQKSDNDLFMEIIKKICDYAVANDMEPDDTLDAIANNILAVLEICTFNNWEKEKQ